MKFPIRATFTAAGGADPVGGVTGASGEFRLAGVPTGRQSFRMTMPGYQDQLISSLLITAAKEVVLNMAMTESARALARRPYKTRFLVKNAWLEA